MSRRVAADYAAPTGHDGIPEAVADWIARDDRRMPRWAASAMLHRFYGPATVLGRSIASRDPAPGSVDLLRQAHRSLPPGSADRPPPAGLVRSPWVDDGWWVPGPVEPGGRRDYFAADPLLRALAGWPGERAVAVVRCAADGRFEGEDPFAVLAHALVGPGRTRFGRGFPRAQWLPGTLTAHAMQAEGTRGEAASTLLQTTQATAWLAETAGIPIEPTLTVALPAVGTVRLNLAQARDLRAELDGFVRGGTE